MRRGLSLCICGLIASGFAILVCAAKAQYGRAPSGYYPLGYSGDIFTGTVIQTTDDTITLSYEHGDKTETFEGYATGPCHVPAKNQETSQMPLTKVPIGSRIEIFYEEKTVKTGGTKQKQNQIIGITFLKTKVRGEWLEMKSRVIFYCAQAGNILPFNAF